MVEQEEKINGLRKGMTKEKLLKSMTKEDWHFIDKCKEAEELTTNETAYYFFVQSDQSVQELERTKSIIMDGLGNILLLNEEILKSKTKIKLGEGIDDGQGNKMTPTELDIINLKSESKLLHQISIMKANLARLYTWVGKKGFDKETFFKEAEYNEIVNNIVVRLKKTPYNLIKKTKV